MSDATTGKTEKAVFEVMIRGSIEDVWHEITKTGEQQKCMFNMVMHTDRLEPGGQLRMRTKNGKYTGVVGEILEFDPPRRYAHTMRFTQMDDPPCTVTYDLTQEGGTMIVNTLKAVVETGRPTLGTRTLYVLFALLEPFSPKSTKTENWAL